MQRQSFQALVAVGAVLLAGCASGTTGPPGAPTAPAGQTDTPTTATTPASSAGTVAFYISDEENAIGDFRHLNVTVTRVGFERASADGGGWVEHEVENETVDLTELRGANATLVDEYEVPNGTYGKVFVHVGDVNGTLRSGEQVQVKLPSEKLQIESEFAVDDGSDVEFVFDITVHEAGNSGRYVLRPVISESGTDVPIEPAGDEERREGLNLRFVGDVSPGKNATLSVTRNGTAVENATVLANGETVGTTDADGELAFAVPDTETVTVTVRAGDQEVELEREFESDGG